VCASKGKGRPRPFSEFTHGIFIGLEQTMLDQKPVGCADGELEVVVIQVEVEKTMLCFFVIDEFARITTPTGFAAK
jgi:hypothetical protein